LSPKCRNRYSEGRIGPVVIVRLDEGLRVLQSQTYSFTDSTGACQPVISPDGSTIALAADSTLALVDAHTLKQIDADTTTPDVDTFAPATSGRIGSIIWLNNSDLFVLTRRTGQAAVIRRTGNTYTTSLVYNDHTTMQGGFSAVTATDGKVWMSFPQTIQVYDPSTNAVTALSAYTPTPSSGTSLTQGVVRIGSDMWIVHGDHMGLDRVASDGTILRTITLPTLSPNGYVCSPYCNGLYGHWLQILQSP